MNQCKTEKRECISRFFVEFLNPQLTRLNEEEEQMLANFFLRKIVLINFELNSMHASKCLQSCIASFRKAMVQHGFRRL